MVGGGESFGRYRLIGLLGRGGMGEVWHAQDTVIGRRVALKRLPAEYAQDPLACERFRREALKAASLHQRNVITIFDVGEIDGRLFVTMPIIKGCDLQTVLRGGALPPARAVSIVEQVATALDAAHASGLVHRDVKPSNVLLEPDDFAYLIDFGIAHAAGESRQTATGNTIGTWAYMAPERFRAGAIGPAGDVYALACVLYECLTGEVPFPARMFEQFAVAHMMHPPPRPSEQVRDVAVAFDAVIATGMAKDPTQRYPRCAALAAAARAALTTVRPARPPKTTKLPLAPEVAAPGTSRRSPDDSARRSGTTPIDGPPVPNRQLVLRYAARSDRGLTAAVNEDSVYAGARLLAIADGSGDPDAGEVASQLVVAALAPLDDEVTGGDLLGALDDAVRHGNAAIAAQTDVEPDLVGISASLTAILFAGNRFGLVHIGDSRAYLLRAGELVQITHDDAVAVDHIDINELTPEEVYDHFRQSRPTRALRGHAVEPTLAMREAREGDRYLLCTKGLSDPVSREAINKALLIPDPAESAYFLIELALRGGGPDNISVIIADVVKHPDEQHQPILAGAIAGDDLPVDAQEDAFSPIPPNPQLHTREPPVFQNPSEATFYSHFGVPSKRLETGSQLPDLGDGEVHVWWDRYRTEGDPNDPGRDDDAMPLCVLGLGEEIVWRELDDYSFELRAHAALRQRLGSRLADFRRRPYTASRVDGRPFN